MLSKRCGFKVWLVSKVILSTLLLPRVVLGQVVPDGTTPTPDPGSCLPSCTVTGGTADSISTNLFHSFDQFSIPEGGVLTFDHSPAIRNIITRVTGGDASTINGSLRTDIASDTNLFLLNPNGILFGPNSSLEIGGSFVATTADALKFEDQGTFSASENTSDLTLLTVDPSAFLFTQTAPQPIISQAFAFGLGVPENKSLLLVGGDVVIEPSSPTIPGNSIITVPGGRLELGGIHDAGSIQLSVDGDSFSLTYPDNVPLADVSLNRAGLSVFSPLGRPGEVIINANELSVNDSPLNSITFGAENAGNIVIQASESVTMSNSTISSNTAGAGTGGNLTIITKRLSLERSSLSVTSSGAGQAGEINLNAETVLLDESSGINSNSFGSPFQPAGDAGKIVIQTNTLSLDNRSRITTSTSGEALETSTSGNLIIDAGNNVVLRGESEIASETLGQRDAGNIRINTPALVIDDSTISAAVDEEGNLDSDATGQGGTINIETSFLSLQNGAQVTSSTSGEGEAGAIVLQGESLTINFQEEAEISAATSGPGEGGRVLVRVPNDITLTGDGSLSTRSTGSGPSGDINLQTNGRLSVEDGATVEVSAIGTGDSGMLDVIAETVVLDNGQLLASVEAGEGGNIDLDIEDALVLRGDSSISAEAFNDANGGNVDITAPFIIALFAEGPDGNDIEASAVDGDGGRITIQANTLFNIEENRADGGNMTNDIDASSEAGIDGEVIIQTLEVDPDEGTAPLPSGLAEPEISQGCQVGVSNSGQFTNAGRGGLPINPYAPLSSEGIQEDIYPVGQVAAQPENNSQLSDSNDTAETIAEAIGWDRNNQGDVVLLAATPSFYNSCQHTLTGES